MKVRLETFFLPKAGNTLEEYEDAYCPSEVSQDATDSIRIAVADGATEASFSRLWANLLVEAYCDRTLDPEALQSTVKNLQARWAEAISEKPLPWFAEQKVSSGAFAAIAGLELFGDRQKWVAFAIGDCCIFQTRGNDLVAWFPLNAAEEFDNRPLLISSVPASNNGVFDAVRTTNGVWEPGDTFYLMSDALAAFIFKAYKGLADPIDWLRNISTQELFEDFVRRNRNDDVDGQPLMKNDDVTLLACTVS